MTSHYLHAINLFDVKDWVCLVTGGGTGIGLMFSQCLAANGAKVYIASRHLDVLENAAKVHGTPEALKGSGGQLIPFQMDETDKADIVKKSKELAAKEPHLNLLVNNAGLALKAANGDPSKAEEGAQALSESYLAADPDAWAAIYKTNVTGYYFSSAAFLPMLVKTTATEYGQSGSIINTCSMSGITSNSQGGQEAYNSSKAAVISLTRLLANDFKHKNIRVRVNSIAPGYFPSVMTQNSKDSANKSQWDAEGGQFGEKMDVPAGRPGRDADMAQCLLSLACNQYCNAQTIVCDGGWLLEHGGRGN